jgi:hypothetical protein
MLAVTSHLEAPLSSSFSESNDNGILGGAFRPTLFATTGWRAAVTVGKYQWNLL